jgi:NAD-dependent deacetylase
VNRGATTIATPAATLSIRLTGATRASTPVDRRTVPTPDTFGDRAAVDASSTEASATPASLGSMRPTDPDRAPGRQRFPCSRDRDPSTAAATMAPVDPTLAAIADWLRDAERIVVLTGAGISTESGIPDFRGPNGVFTKNPAAEKTATLQYYLRDPEVRAQAWQNRLHGEYWTATPNAGHRALAALERRAALDTLVTQNIDGLHHQAGSSAEKIVEIHGNVREVKCLTCGWRAPMEVALERVRAGETDPDCPECGGILKSATISFGENLVETDLRRSQEAAARADLFLAAGTSLSVYPAAALPEFALANHARLVVLNAQATPFDGAAAAVVREPLGETLPAIVDAV